MTNFRRFEVLIVMTVADAPKILIANDLMSGEVLFMGRDGWVVDHREASIARTGEASTALDEAGKAEMKRNTVVDAYLVDVEIAEDGEPVPTHYREKMRTKGPSNRPDLGKQAEGH